MCKSMLGLHNCDGWHTFARSENHNDWVKGLTLTRHYTSLGTQVVTNFEPLCLLFLVEGCLFKSGRVSLLPGMFNPTAFLHNAPQLVGGGITAQNVKCAAGSCIFKRG